MELSIPGARSLKDKRRIIKSLIDKSKNNFNIAIAETEENEKWQSSTISVVTVSNKKIQLERLLTQYINFVDEFPGLYLRDYQIQYI